MAAVWRPWVHAAYWQEALTSHHVNLTVGLLEHRHNMAASVPQNQPPHPRERHRPFMTWPQMTHIYAASSLLEVSH